MPFSFEVAQDNGGTFRLEGMSLGHRLLLSGYTAFITYMILNFIFGTSGYLEMQRLSSYQDLLKENLIELEMIHNELSSRAYTLRSDSETLTLKARDIGYLKSNEGFLLVPGSPGPQGSYRMGNILKYSSSTEERKPLFRILAFFTGAALFLLLGFSFQRTYSLKPSRQY